MDQPTVILGPVGSTLDAVSVRRTPKRPSAADQSESAPESAGKQRSGDDGALQQAVTKAEEVVHQVDSHIQISIDKDLNRPVVKVVDSQSGELIRQIPAEEMLEIAKHLGQVEGLLFKERV